MFMQLLFLIPAAAALASKPGCTAVPLDKCGTKLTNSCLKCGTKSSWDCEKCCPSCTRVTKGSYSYCDCTGPKPPPGPPPGGDSWDYYTVAGMNVTSVTGGHNKSNYEKVVVMLHGGGASSQEWVLMYNSGWFGNLTGLKYVFPTSAIPSHIWFITYKNGCGENQDCAYNISSIRESATRVASLIAHERALPAIGGEASNVFLAGFSEGAQLTGYMQIAKLSYALGGTIVME